MDLEQLNKKIEWLDDERRKDKTIIAMLTERISVLESNLTNASKEMKSVQTESNRLSAFVAKTDQLQESLGKTKIELFKSIEANDKLRDEQIQEYEKTRQAEISSISKSITELRKSLDSITDIKRTLQIRQEEEFRLSRLIGDVDKKITDLSHTDEDYKRSMRLMEEGRRTDSKRLTDLLGEVSAIRKRQDEIRGKVDLTSDTNRKLDLRIADIVAAETERRQIVNAFIEKQSMQQLERDRTWKDWQTRFESFDAQTALIEQQLLTLDTMQRSLKRSQDTFDEVTQKFDRRINEITEISRINEDRFRQEWGAFKTDDQKRWTNYTISQDEQYRELARQFDQYQDRLVQLEDLTQEINDLLSSVNEETQKRLQMLINITHTWAEDLNNITRASG